MRKFALLCAAAAIAAPVSAYAQQITSQIEGQVTSAAGEPLANATVVVTDARTGASQTFTTEANGRFVARGLTVGGPYTVTAESPGFQGQSVEDLITTLQGATTLTFNLEPAATAAAEGTIVVTASRANVQLREIGPGTAFSTEILQNAPTFNRDIRDIIRLDPRVSLDRDDGGSGQDRISCLGGNDRGNTFTVDGIIQGDVYGLNDTGFSSRSSTPLPYDAIRETQVQFAPFDVEYGQFTGCAINVVTRSGSNRFTGGGFFEYTNADLRGDTVDGRPVAPIEPDKRWGAFLGGPIIPDRLFFFGAYEEQQAGQAQDDGPAGAGFANDIAGVPVSEFDRVSEILSRVYGIETGGLLRNRDFSNERYFGRIDWQITDGHRLELTAQRLEEGSIRPDDFSSSATNPSVTGANTFYVSGTVSNYYSGRLFSQWTDRISTELRYSRSEVTDQQNPLGGGEAQDDSPIPRIVVGVDTGTGADRRFGRIIAGPGFSRSANDLQTTIEQYKALLGVDAGSHSLKLGVELNRADIFNLFVQNATGTLFFRNAADLEAGILSNGTNTNPTGQQLVGGQAVGAAGNFSASGDVRDAAAAFTRSIYSVYLQDDWRVTDQLNVVLGVRTDWYDGGRPGFNPQFFRRYGFNNGTGFSNIDPVVLPRFGFTYDFDGFSVLSRGQLRGGVGLFSGGDPLVWFGNAFQNNGFGFAEGTTRSSACPAGPIDVVQNGRFTGVPTCFQADAQNQAGRGLGDTQSVDPNIKTPTVLRFNIGLQSNLDLQPSGFLSGWRLNLDYIYSQYRNPFTLVDLAATPDARLGVNGFTIDGRPIYRSIDPSVAGCMAQLVGVGAPPVYQNVNPACFNTSRDDELMLTNQDGYRSHIASVLLSKSFDGGFFTTGGSTYVNFGYAYTDAQDRRNLYNSTAGSNYDLTAAFDRQNPEASRGFYESRHNITFSANLAEQFIPEYDTNFGFTFVARSGRPYSLTFSGGGVFGDSVSGNDNALVYVPTGPNDPNVSPGSNPAAVQQLADFLGNLNCAQGFAGRTIARNTCTNDWYFDLDLRFSQEIPGPLALFGRGRDRIEFYGMFDNFLNFLDDSWNVQRRRNFSGLQDVAGLGGVDAQGRYIITNFIGADTFADDNQINTSSSVWRLKFGVSYRF